MKELSVSLIAALLGLCLTCHCGYGDTRPTRASAKGQDWIDNAKEKLKFDTWPGKEGALKAGFVFTRKDFNELDGFKLKSTVTRIDKIQDRELARREWNFTNDEARLFLNITVSKDSTDDAQKMLLRFAANTAAPLDFAWVRAHSAGLDVGDIGFLGGVGGGKPLSQVTTVMFVRNNVVVLLRKTVGTDLDISNLSEEIDKKIGDQKDFTADQLKPFVPVVRKFAPKDRTVKSDDSVRLKLNMSDPQKLQIKALFETNFGNVRFDENTRPPAFVFRPSFKVGAAKITVFAINEALLFTKAKAEVTVEE